MKSKSLLTSILFYLTTGMLLISVYNSINFGFGRSYEFYMFTLVFFLWFCYRKINEPADGNQEPEDKNTPKAGDSVRTGGKKRIK